MTITSPSTLPGNLLSIADSDFESGSPTWVAYSGANTPGAATTYAYTGTYSLKWTANSTSDSYVTTGYYPCTGSNGYDVSGYVLTPSAAHDTYIGVAFYDNTHTIIGSIAWGSDNVSTVNAWQPLVCAVTSPSNAVYLKILVWVGTGVVNSEPFAIDLLYLADSVATVWVDWTNPTFTAGSNAGQDFMDLTPWIRLDQGINMNRGRQDAISEVQTGQATFYVQNDMGWFTPQRSNSPYFPNVNLGARTKIQVIDQAGVWFTRFDGAISEITYSVDETGDTNLSLFSCSDVLAFLNRQDDLSCWTKQTILLDSPWLHWTLNDTGSANICAETSGNNGPQLRAVVYGTGTVGTMTWNNTSAGVETLADAAAPNNTSDAAYWNPGSVVPGNPVRGLSAGVVGPFSAPIGSVALTPVINAETGKNVFTGTDGYQLNAQLYVGGVPTPMVTATGNYTIEAYFCASSAIGTSAGLNVGPFTVIGLGSSRQATCLNAGIYLSGSTFVFDFSTYAQPPSFAYSSFATLPTTLAAASTPMTVTANLPHHLVMEITAGSPATLNVWLDSVNIGSINLPTGQVYDTICVGGAYGGHGNFSGNISCVSIYQYLLSQQQITNHCMMGQYGCWEQTTDNCITMLGRFAGIPKFWNNLTAQNHGLTMTEYLSISDTTAISSMQTYEQAERGLLFVNSMGQLTFDTRDWRMGYGAADLTIPASVYDNQLGYELIDTYLLNEAATGTTVFYNGVTWISQSSQNSFGTYSNGTATSPIQLPLITWSRSWEQLGVTSNQFWSDPNLNDNSSWQANVRSSPRLIPGQLTCDVLTMEPASFIGGLNVNKFYSVDIDNMITLTGLPPGSFPDQTGSNDYFIEGIDEIVGLTERAITFYVSPASIQRAWKPGDTTYGTLGVTSRLGISDPDVSVGPSLGKSVAHDGGPPYWPPAFQTVPLSQQIGFANGTIQNPVITPTIPSVQGDCLLVSISAPTASTITVADTQNGSYTSIGSVTLSSSVVQYLFANFNSLPLNPATDTVTVTTSASKAYGTALYRVAGITAVDIAAHTATGTSTTPAVTGSGPMTYTNDWELVSITNNNSEQSNVPANWTQLGLNSQGTAQNQLFFRQATTTSPDAFSSTLNGSSTPWGAIAISFTVSTFFMNNPTQNGHGFIGAADMRGIRDNLALALNPPMCVVGQINDVQTYTTGNNSIVPGRVVWDQVYIDTVGGMGLIPSWPGWYCVMVPGVYEISASLVWQSQAGGAAGARTGWIIIARNAAALVAAGAGNPGASDTYVCPIGETVNPNTSSYSPICSPTTRIYCGVGDMIGLGGMHTQGSSITTGNVGGGSIMSIRWLGFNTTNDQQPYCGLPAAGGVVDLVPPVNKLSYTKTYSATDTYAYYGTSSTRSPQQINHNGTIYQGWPSGGSDTGTGSMTSYALFNHTAIASDLSGATIVSVKLLMQNIGLWYPSGSLIIGWTTNGTWSTSAPTSGMHYNDMQYSVHKYQTTTMDITGAGIGVAFQSGSATALAFGNNSTKDLTYNGAWTGGTYPQLIITYTK